MQDPRFAREITAGLWPKEGTGQADRPHLPKYWQPLLPSMHGTSKSNITSQFMGIKASVRGISSTHLQINLWFLLKMRFQVTIYGSATSISRKKDAGYGIAQQLIYQAQATYSAQEVLPIPHYLLCSPAESSIRYTMDFKGEQNRTKIKVWAGRDSGRKSEYAHFSLMIILKRWEHGQL